MAEAAVGTKSLGTMFAAASADPAKKKDNNNPSGVPPPKEELWAELLQRMISDWEVRSRKDMASQLPKRSCFQLLY